MANKSNKGMSCGTIIISAVVVVPILIALWVFSAVAQLGGGPPDGQTAICGFLFILAVVFTVIVINPITWIVRLFFGD